ncbi:MAG: YitT family protein [Clostridia bacterium]
MNKLLKELVKVTIGCFLYAIGISVFFQPNEIAPGGFSGMAVIVNYLTNVPTGTLLLIFNIPISIVGYKKLGRHFMILTIYAIVVSSVMMNILEQYVVFETEPLLGSLYGGITVGLGLGLSFSVGGSTGGTDIITRLIHKKYPHLGLGQIMILLDLVVVTLGAIVFGTIHSALYASVGLWISSKLIDSVIEGPDLAKLVYIISDHNEQIANEICTKLNRGATLLNGTGAYTKENKNVIICAVRRQQIPRLKRLASEIDDNSFMIVTDVREVLGDGFKLSSKK